MFIIENYLFLLKILCNLHLIPIVSPDWTVSGKIILEATIHEIKTKLGPRPSWQLLIWPAGWKRLPIPELRYISHHHTILTKNISHDFSCLLRITVDSLLQSPRRCDLWTEEFILMNYTIRLINYGTKWFFKDYSSFSTSSFSPNSSFYDNFLPMLV